MFDDDTSLFSKVLDVNQSTKKQNFDLQKISEWAFQWKIQFNPDSSKQANEVIFSRKSKSILIPLLPSTIMMLRNVLIKNIYVLS